MKQGAKTGLVVCPDSQQGQVGSQLVAATANTLGLEMKDPVFFAQDTTDFGPIATKIVSANPESVYMSYVAGDQVVNLLGALKDSGYVGKILPGELDNQTLENCIKRVGVEYMEGMETGSYDPVGVETDPVTLKYIDAYKAAYGDWFSGGCFWVGPWFLFEDAINATQSTDVERIGRLSPGLQEGRADPHRVQPTLRPAGDPEFQDRRQRTGALHRCGESWRVPVPVDHRVQRPVPVVDPCLRTAGRLPEVLG